MKTVKGDLIHLAKKGHFDVIIHGCNCFCTMGAGIAKTIKKEFPPAFEADCTTLRGDEGKLGTISFAKIQLTNTNFTIINAYTQYHWSGSGVKANYDAIRAAFKEVKTKFSGLRIGYPAIGAGLAGGDWAIIAAIIEEELAGEDHTFVEFMPL